MPVFPSAGRQCHDHVEEKYTRRVEKSRENGEQQSGMERGCPLLVTLAVSAACFLFL